MGVQRQGHSQVPSPLAPSGTLQAGVVQAPTAGVFFVALDADQQPHGVTVDLLSALAREHGLPLALRVFPNSGECTDAVAAAEIDVAFMPVDPARAARVAFGPAYYLLESTYLVSAASSLETLQDVDRPHVRVIGIADTTTIRAAARTLLRTTPVAVRGVDEAIAMLREGRADALALSRDSLNQVAPTIPGSRITPGGFQQTTISIALPPGRPDALALAADFLTRAKRTGQVRQALDAVGLPHEQVAP